VALLGVSEFDSQLSHAAVNRHRVRATWTTTATAAKHPPQPAAAFSAASAVSAVAAAAEVNVPTRLKLS
jgi:hypothetical protein